MGVPAEMITKWSGKWVSRLRTNRATDEGGSVVSQINTAELGRAATLRAVVRLQGSSPSLRKIGNGWRVHASRISRGEINCLGNSRSYSPLATSPMISLCKRCRSVGCG